MKTGPRPIRIGISACFFHADPKRAIFKGKTLQYLEQSMAQWVMSEGALVYLIPAPPEGSPVSAYSFAEDLDGLILGGGSDVSPLSYKEQPLRPEWEGDRIRDLYEIELFHAFRERKKPILGICRGLQLINVALQGTLYQDIRFQVEDCQEHRNWEIYDHLFHSIQLEPNSILLKQMAGYSRASDPYGVCARVKVNSVHHQGIKSLGDGLVIEARSVPDGVIEAIRLKADHFVYGVQWHPEFQDPNDSTLFNSKLILRSFLNEVNQSRP